MKLDKYIKMKFKDIKIKVGNIFSNINIGSNNTKVNNYSNQPKINNTENTYIFLVKTDVINEKFSCDIKYEKFDSFIFRNNSDTDKIIEYRNDSGYKLSIMRNNKVIYTSETPVINYGTGDGTFSILKNK